MHTMHRAPVAVEGDVISLSVNPVSADSVAVQLSTGAVLRFTLGKCLH